MNGIVFLPYSVSPYCPVPRHGGDIIIRARSMIRPVVLEFSLGECRSLRGRMLDDFRAVLPRAPNQCSESGRAEIASEG